MVDFLFSVTKLRVEILTIIPKRVLECQYGKLNFNERISKYVPIDVIYNDVNKLNY